MTPSHSFESALPGLIRDVAPKLRGFAMRMCGDPHDADDLVQDVFLQAQRRWSTFRGDSSPGTWMFAIAARLCRARFRRRSRFGHGQMPRFSDLTPFSQDAVSRAGQSESPLGRAEHREAIEAVQGAVVSMPENFRVPFVLTEILELPVQQVAEALNLKPETVRTRVHRARLLLRNVMLSRVSRVPAPAPIYERRVCVDLLAAKLASLDEHKRFAAGDEVMCRRCRAVFHELDLVKDACTQLASGTLPAPLRASLLEALRSGGVNSGTPAGRGDSKKRPRAVAPKARRSPDAARRRSVLRKLA